MDFSAQPIHLPRSANGSSRAITQAFEQDKVDQNLMQWEDVTMLRDELETSDQFDD